VPARPGWWMVPSTARRARTLGFNRLQSRNDFPFRRTDFMDSLPGLPRTTVASGASTGRYNCFAMCFF